MRVKAFRKILLDFYKAHTDGSDLKIPLQSIAQEEDPDGITIILQVMKTKDYEQYAVEVNDSRRKFD